MKGHMEGGKLPLEVIFTLVTNFSDFKKFLQSKSLNYHAAGHREIQISI